MEAQVFINTGRGHLAGLNGQDHRGGAGDAVAPGKDPFQPGNAAVVGGDDVVVICGDPCLGKALGVHHLPHRHENHVAGNSLLRLVGLSGGRTASPDLADDLGLYHKGGDSAIVISLNPYGGFQGKPSQPSAMAPSISSGRAVMSEIRRR